MRTALVNELDYIQQQIAAEAQLQSEWFDGVRDYASERIDELVVALELQVSRVSFSTASCSC